MDKDVSYPAWVNTPGFVYKAEKEETTERLATPLEYQGIDPRTPGYINALDDPTRFMPERGATQVMDERQLTREIAADTQRLREEDWVDRYHRAKESGEPLRVNWSFVTVSLVYALLILGLVWFAASWIGHFLGI